MLDDILGYEVEDHIVDIRYYRPRGDNKEAWDNIDITGFLGQPDADKGQFSLSRTRSSPRLWRSRSLAVWTWHDAGGNSGIQEQLSVFFKLPMTKGGRPNRLSRCRKQCCSTG